MKSNRIFLKTTKYLILIYMLSSLLTACGMTNHEEANMVTPQYFGYETLSDKYKEIYDLVYKSLANRQETTIPGDLHQDTFNKIYLNIIADHPELFDVNGFDLSLSDDRKNILFRGAFKYSDDEIEEKIQQLDEVIARAVTEIDLQENDYNKAEAVFRYVIGQVLPGTNLQNGQNVYSALVEGEAVCTGYAAAAELLLQKVGIESVMITGKAEGVDHAWVMLKLEDQYYFMDPIWADSSPEELPERMKGDFADYSYFLMNAHELSMQHVPDGTVDLSKCAEAESAIYFRRNGLYFEAVDSDQLEGILDSLGTSGDYVQICTSHDCYRDVRLALKKLIEERDSADSSLPGIGEADNHQMNTITLFVKE